MAINTLKSNKVQVKPVNKMQSSVQKTFALDKERNWAVQNLRDFNQTGSATFYSIKFKQYALKTGYDDQFLRCLYYTGLKDSVKDVLVHHEKPKNLEELIQLSIVIDNRLWTRRQEEREEQLKRGK